jgi:putative nucleotidyltransferase with HDIG domain
MTEIHVVSPGEFKVTTHPSAVLETCLGSCIGVGLYDREAAIGGLGHILLPTGSEEKERIAPARYARSCIPLLLSEMIRLGGSKERIVAAIAGGALILAQRKLSVDMNIGRKNSDMVRQILDMEGIPIVRHNVGGHFGRVFRLKPATGETDIRTFGGKKHKALKRAATGEINLSDLKARIDRLKPLPEIARRIISRIEYSESSLADLEEYILKDQVITANILKVCNSAYYGFQYQISSINRAVVLIGAETLKNIVLAASLYNLYKERIDGYFLEKGEMLKHSVCCGMVAELIATEKKLKDPDVVFTAGLLHDIGKVILDQDAFERFNLIMDSVLNENMPFLDAENKILGCDHAQTGGLVAKEWNLPEVLVEAISFHHQPEKAIQNPEVVSIVHIADVICSMSGVGGGADALANPIRQFAISAINLQKDDVNRIVEKLPEIVRHGEYSIGQRA